MKTLPLLFVVIALFATGEAIKCYQCVGTDPKCGDPFDKSSGINETTFVSPCSCVKEVLVVSGATYTARYCSIINFAVCNTTLVRDNGFSIVSYSTYFCDTDLCNGANSVNAVLSAFIALAMLLTFANWN